MKTRNGFVSNSSSSSFIVLGFLATGEENLFEDPDDPYQTKEEYREKGWSSLYVDGKGTLFGFVIDDVEYNLSDEIFSLDELQGHAKKLKEAFPDKEIYLYKGTRAS